MFIVNMAKMFVVGYTTLLNGMAEVQLCGSLRLTALNQLQRRGDDDDGFPCDTVPSVPACSADAEYGSMEYRSWPSELKAHLLLPDP